MNGIINTDIPMAEYMKLRAASSGLIKKVVDQCPLAAWQDSYLNPDRCDEFGDAADLGTLVHSLLLENGTGTVVEINPEDYPSSTGNVPKGWTNNDIRAARDACRASGQIPVLTEDMEQARAVEAAVRVYIDSLKESAPAVWAAFQPGGGDAECVITWNDKIGNMPCKIRPDLLAADRKTIIDLKTTATSANPATWSRTQMTGQSSYVSSAFYRRGVQQLCGESPEYIFLVVEVNPPYLCSLIGTDPRAFELGEEKVLAGLDLWSRCVAKNQFPAYPNRVCYPELPVFVDYGWEDQQHGIEYNMDILRGVKT